MVGRLTVCLVMVVVGGDRTTRFVTFPDYLVVQMKKFSLSDDWTPKKLGERDNDLTLFINLSVFLSVQNPSNYFWNLRNNEKW